jgi:hypothetical protein
MRKYFSGQMVSDIRNIITSSESFKTSSVSASSDNNFKAEKIIERCGNDPEYQKLRNRMTDHYKRHFIRNKTDVDRRGIEPCRQRSEEPETSSMYHGRAFSKSS